MPTVPKGGDSHERAAGSANKTKIQRGSINNTQRGRVTSLSTLDVNMPLVFYIAKNVFLEI